MRQRSAFILLLCILAVAACSDSPTGGGGGGDTPGEPSVVSKVSPAQQDVPAGESVPLVVSVADAKGRPVPGAMVTFKGTFYMGSVSATQAQTGPDGTAQVTWKAGVQTGSDSVRAQIANLASTAFTLNITPNGRVTVNVSLTDSMIPLGTYLPAFGSAPFRGPTLAAAFAGGGKLAAPFVPRMLPARRAPRDRHVPGALVVTFRPEAIQAPAGSARLRMDRRRAAAVAESMTRTLQPHLNAQVRLGGVSPVLGAARVRVPAGRESDAAAALRADPAVLRVDRDTWAWAAGGLRPDDPFLPTQAWHYEMIDLPRAWKRTTGGAGVLVAVVDDGTRFDHPELTAALTRDGYDFVSDVSVATDCGARSNAGDGDGYDADPTTPAEYDGCALSEGGGHGVHVAGTVGAAGNNAVGMSGVAWTVRIRPVRVLGTVGGGSTFDVAQGVLYAAGLPASDGRGGTVQAPTAARIINLSLGSSAEATVLHDAVKAATAAGALVVAAAGNENTATPSYPAAYPEVLAVAAVGPTRQRAGYSNFGPHVDIAAPGGDFQALDGHWSAGVASTAWNFAAGAPTYALAQGTSMAAPHVSGAAALLLAHDPSLTAAQLRERLTGYAVDLGASGPDPLYGAGLLNVRNSLARTMAFESRLLVRLYHNNRPVATEEAVGGSVTFSRLPAGGYQVLAGMDDEGDGVIATGGLRWGMLRAANGIPAVVDVDTPRALAVSFPIGYAAEREPTAERPDIQQLMPYGAVHGRISTVGDVDVYYVGVTDGTWVFQTLPVNGACGMTTNADTEIRVLTSDGQLLGVNDDIAPDRFNLCSRLSGALPAGLYILVVSGYTPGGYRVLAQKVE